MRKLYYMLLPVYLVGFVAFAVLKFIFPATPLEVVVKLYFVSNLSIMAMYLLLNGKLKIFRETIVFYIFSIFPLVYGLYQFGIRSETFAHLFAIVLPTLGMSFGYYLGEHSEQDRSLVRFDKIMKFSYITNILIIIFFQLSVTLGFARYPAIAPTGLIISSIYYLGNKKWPLFFSGLIFIVLSGKRASLVMVMFALLVFIYDLIRNKSIDPKLFKRAKKIIGVSSIFIAAVVFYLWNFTRYLNRVKLVFQFDFSDPHAMYIATGGRSEEIINILGFLSEKPLRYIFGSGFGVKVEVAENFYRHYSHFSPLSYALIFGVIFSVIIYGYFFKRILTKGDVSHPLYFTKLVFAGFFASSFLGAIVMNDINMWVFYGLTIYIAKVSSKKNAQQTI